MVTVHSSTKQKNCSENTMKKEDRRTTYTKDLIKKSFLELLRQKPISKISVTEICKSIEINRGTFYLHYADCYQVLEELQEEFCDKMIAAVEKGIAEGNSPLDHILNLHEISRTQNDLYVILMRTEYPMHTFKKFINYGKTILIEQKLSNTPLSTEETDWLADYIIGASFSYLQHTLYLDENVRRESLIHEFLEAGLAHFQKK